MVLYGVMYRVKTLHLTPFVIVLSNVSKSDSKLAVDRDQLMRTPLYLVWRARFCVSRFKFKLKCLFDYFIRLFHSIDIILVMLRLCGAIGGPALSNHL